MANIDYGNNSEAGKYIDVNGIKMYCEVYGTGEPLLLLHGNGRSLGDYKYQIPFFAEEFQVIAVDSRSQGKSVDDGEKLSYQMMADDFNALLDALEIKSANVIGWSDGGVVGLLLAISYPEKVKKLTITGANTTCDSKIFDPAVNTLIEEYTKTLESAEQNAETKNTLKLFRMMKVEPNIPPTDLQKIKCPVFVIGGDKDAVKPSHTVQVFENIPNSYLWILPAAGHGTVHKYSGEFNTKVKEFLTEPYQTAVWNDFEE